MPDAEFEARIESLRPRVEPLEKLVHACAARLPAPLRYHSGKNITDFATASRMPSISVC